MMATPSDFVKEFFCNCRNSFSDQNSGQNVTIGKTGVPNFFIFLSQNFGFSTLNQIPSPTFG